MKKNLVAAGLGIILTLSAFAGTNNVDYKATEHFKQTFKGAVDVNWSVIGDFNEVKFTWSGEKMAVFYTDEGQYVATTRVVDFATLPVNAKIEIQEKYNKYTVIETAEVDHKDEGFAYYVSLENEKERIILKSTVSGDVNIFKKVKL